MVGRLLTIPAAVLANWFPLRSIANPVAYLQLIRTACARPRYRVPGGQMFERVDVVGRGRVGRALAARLEQRGVTVEGPSAPDLVIVCVPDRAIASVAVTLAPGPWVCHVSGATPLAALDPHTRRFSVHPLQTFTTRRGPEQIDGAFAAVCGEVDAAVNAGIALADLLGLRPFTLPEANRVAYHAGAVMASNFLVTLYRAAARTVGQAGAPAEALIPLMRRTMENGFDLTGPIARGDEATVEAHLRVLHDELPDLEPLYRALASATRP
jgi:predicted short-subunit dehydrogenase-like oxidoreductase (DUF2520 family)